MNRWTQLSIDYADQRSYLAIQVAKSKIESFEPDLFGDSSEYDYLELM